MKLGRPDLAVLWLERATQHDTRPVYADNLADAWIALAKTKGRNKPIEPPQFFAGFAGRSSGFGPDRSVSGRPHCGTQAI